MKRFLCLLLVLVMGLSLAGGALAAEEAPAEETDAAAAVDGASNTVQPLYYNNHSYEVVLTEMTFAKAEEYCEQHGGHLATIESAAENAAVTEYLCKYYSGGSFMIGLYDEAGSKGTWSTWVTGTPATYKNWGAGQPDWTGQKICVINTTANSTYHWEVGQWDNGWDGDYSFLMEKDNVSVNGWQKPNGSWYYYQSGRKVTGWKQIGGSWYYFNADGVMQTGWLKSGSTWYYLRSGGAMATGWVRVGSYWYYMNASGAMLTGWLKYGGSWYYLRSGGAMATGWVRVGSCWYYMNNSGIMLTGWLKYGGYWYYLNSSGAMVSSCTMTIDGVVYQFDAGGHML